MGAEKEMAKLTGVVHDYAKASAKDRDLIKAETQALEKDLQKAMGRAISIGEAKAKAVEQRIAEHLKNTKRYLQVELNESVEEAADNVFKILEGKRQKIADNYLSLKAYACASADKIQDVVTKGHGRAMSSIGDFLVTVGAMGPVKAKPAEGLGMGGSDLPEIFSGKVIKVSNAVAAINGLVNEYTMAPPRCVPAGLWVSASTSWTSSRSPCSALVSSRSIRSTASLATSCSSTAAPLVCPTRCPTSPSSPLA